MARKQQTLIIAGVVALFIIAGLVWWQTARRGPVASPAAVVLAPAAPPSAQGSPAPEATGPSLGETPEAPKPKEPLAPLLPGSSLTDERFAAVSAKIVTAALGLKKDKDWEVNVVAYMAKALDEAKISETEFKQYAEALNQYPDRGRSVAQNIVDKAEKKLGYRISMKSLPMFKLDDQKVKQIDKQLQKKLK